MNELSPSLGILSSMITPAVLILASGSLIMTTSQRLSRVVERVRKLAQEFAALDKQQENIAVDKQKRTILYTLLRKSAIRCKLLTRTMRFLYISLSLFVATSLSIGVTSLWPAHVLWIPTVFGMAGAVCLFISSAILIIESRDVQRYCRRSKVCNRIEQSQCAAISKKGSQELALVVWQHH